MGDLVEGACRCRDCGEEEGGEREERRAESCDHGEGFLMQGRGLVVMAVCAREGKVARSLPLFFSLSLLSAKLRFA